MKYRKKPIVVDAEQWAGDTEVAGVELLWSGDGLLRTREGPVPVGPGDWIITGEDGEQYARTDAMFRLTFDPVGEG